ncbi:MAG: WecB/TagA/CpsF family glycosyltransferase [Gemmatimonadaceae bacterium]|nr:WecB/TagA/CpsF family glycosyltransferase [Gemmatimonadaceae bacterium]
MIDNGKKSILGVHVDAVNYAAAVDRTIAAAQRRDPFIVAALPVHGIMTGALDPVHRYRLNSFDLVVPDGQPVRWALNLIHKTSLAERVYGPNLMLALCARAAARSLPIYLFGSRQETLDKLRTSLTRKYPRLQIAGSQPGRFTTLSKDEREQLAMSISASGAAITFAGLGCPRQEIWAYENRTSVGMPIVCVGAAFDFHAGIVPQAPRRLQRAGLEWAFRLRQEPRRLWRRYLYFNPLYLGMIAAQATGAINYDERPAFPPLGDTNLA